MGRSFQPDPSGVTELLGRLREGQEGAAGPLFEQIHTELRRLAQGQRWRWKGDPSLRTTALAHEAYLNLVGPEERSWANRSHFFAVAAGAMRHILIDRARRMAAEKRGGGAPLVSLDRLRETLGREVAPAEEHADERITAAESAKMLTMLDEALNRLDEEHPRVVRGVECRFFGGMTIEETAEALGVSAATVSRDWIQAKGWLYREMRRLCGEDETEDDETER